MEREVGYRSDRYQVDLTRSTLPERSRPRSTMALISALNLQDRTVQSGYRLPVGRRAQALERRLGLGTWSF